MVDHMTPEEFGNLSDEELVARMVNLGLPEDDARSLAKRRHHPGVGNQLRCALDD